MRHPAPRVFESLEPRLAMAGLVTFADVDGDTVTVRTNRGTDAQLGAALTLAPTGTRGGYQLRQVALGGPVFAGTNLTITARPSAIGGDGQVDVGEIVTALDLGRVTVAGDLGRIIAGNANLATPGVAALTVVSIGQRGTVTGAPNFETVVIGPVPTIRVAGNLVARFAVGGRAADARWAYLWNVPPSLVFYAGGTMRKLDTAADVAAHLADDPRALVVIDSRHEPLVRDALPPDCTVLARIPTLDERHYLVLGPPARRDSALALAP